MNLKRCKRSSEQLHVTEHRQQKILATGVQFNKYKEMQRLLDLDRAAWDEQHKTLGRRSSNPAASFTLGSVFGGVANAIRGVGGQMQGGSGQGAQGEQQEDALASAVAAAKQQEQQQELLDVPLVPEEEVVWPDVAPHPVRCFVFPFPAVAVSCCRMNSCPFV